MSTLDSVKELTSSSDPVISNAAKRALYLNQELINGAITSDEFNELLEDVVKLDKINQEMLTVEAYRLIVLAYKTIVTLKTISSL